VPVGTRPNFCSTKTSFMPGTLAEIPPSPAKEETIKINIMQASGGTHRLFSHARPSGLLTGVWLTFAPQTSHIPET